MLQQLFLKKVCNSKYFIKENKMKKLQKRVKRNKNIMEQYACICGANCQCYCGPGGYPYATAKESLRNSMELNISKGIIS